MSKETITEQCSDPTRSLTIEIPCVLAIRTEKYAVETGTDLSGVVIEALDKFLRESTSS